MPLTRKHKSREKRSRQSDVMSNILKMDVILSGFPSQDFESDHEGKNIKMDQRS